jgi:hypothetical protein
MGLGCMFMYKKANIGCAMLALIPMSALLSNYFVYAKKTFIMQVLIVAALLFQVFQPFFYK